MSDENTEGSGTATVTPLRLAQVLSQRYDDAGHPQDLLDMPEFEYGVRLLCDPATAISHLIDCLMGTNNVLAAMAAEALARRDDGVQAMQEIWAFFGKTNAWTVYFMLRILMRHVREPVVARLMVVGAAWWARHPIMARMLNQFVAARLAQGELPSLRPSLDQYPGVDAGELEDRLACLADPLAGQMREALAAWLRERINPAFLHTVGRLWTSAPDGVVIEHPALVATLDGALHAIEGARPQSLLVVGEAGVGKSALVRALGARLQRKGWHVFQAGASDVMAGQTYIGELENRLRELVAQLAVGKRIVWYVPAFHEMYYAGRHRYSPIGVLDIVLPAIERGELCVIGELAPQSLEKLLQQRPRLRHCFRVFHLEAVGAATAQDLGERYLAQDALAKRYRAAPDVVKEATELARQYLSSRALPGSVFELLRESITHLQTETRTRGPLTREVLLHTLAQMTGLPASVLDDRAGLDPAGLRAFFGQRVMGQPEAVDCLVDRIAMLKAGLTDPGRPIGVFLFAGPTGTGKTEVAKSLAQFLFGSMERMIRLDMSEFQESASLARIVGETGENVESEALTNRIRKQPFAVVLLDEFEKAHPRVWDLFLQVFDDGRLTDAQGNLADFRHSIIILTTNVGATEHQGTSLGFTANGGDFAEQQVTRAVSRTFRPEFVNRLDRVIVFRPLSRMVMRDILKKELKAVQQRRGLRNRDWAVEWEASAIEFLLEKGFTQDMGARPLRRAIDRYVLAPIATTIVEHRVPQGDQFLFVRAAGEALEVEFVDPDAPESGAPAAPVSPSVSEDVREIMLSPTGTESQRLWLRAQFEDVARRFDDDDWRHSKETLLRQMQHSGFWNDANRHLVLQRIAALDAVEAGAGTARSLVRRLEARTGKAGAPRVVVSSLAQQIYLLQAALHDVESGESGDAYLGIEASAVQGSRVDEASWLRQVADMYLAWGRKRHLRVQVLEGPQPEARRWVLSASGLGAYRILSRENGLHVMEEQEDGGSVDRLAARVRVVRQPVAPNTGAASTLALALRCLESLPADTRVTRRYRAKPSPLVRDVVNDWRTGRLDQVLGGDFDLMAGRQA